MNSVRNFPGRYAKAAPAGLLLLFLLRLLLTAASSAATFDEVLHLYAGALYWQHSPLQAIIDNPLLIQALMGLPISLAVHPALPLDQPYFGERFATLALSSDFMWSLNDSGFQMLWLGRLVVMGLALLLAALLYHWGRQLTGRAAGGLLALFLFTFDPNVIAHSALATTDTGTAFFMLLAAFMLWRYWQRPGRVRYVLAGLCLGLAISSKFSALAMLPAIPLLALYQAWRTRPGWRGAALALAQVGGWLLLAGLVLLAVQRFDLAVLAVNWTAARGAQQAGHPTYLLGQTNVGGWWYYFPVVYLAKTPLPALLLVGLGLGVVLRRRWWAGSQLWLLLLVVIPAGAALVSHINIGYRHLLPILPPLFLLTAHLARPGAWPGRPGRLVVGGSLAALAVVSLLAHPHYLAYFNRLAGGPANGWRVAVDSNLDWGQDVGRLAGYLAERHIPAVRTGLFSTTPPQVYGVPAEVLPLWPLPAADPLVASFYPPRPAAGVYALSATQLVGVFLDDPGTLAWFRARRPTGRAGYSIFVYDVPPDGPLTGVALAGVGLPDVTPAGYEATIATNNVTLRWFDAQRGLVWANSTSFWSVVGAGDVPAEPLLADLYPPAARQEVSSRPGGPALAYSFYHWPESPLSGVAWQPAANGFAGPFRNPQTDSMALAWLGYAPALPEMVTPGQVLKLLTGWRVLDPPPAGFHLFLHLLDETGEIVAQDDGWGVRPAGLSAGDEVIQLHRLALPAEMAPGRYTLRLGVYDVASGQRYLVGAADGLVIGEVGR